MPSLSSDPFMYLRRRALGQPIGASGGGSGPPPPPWLGPNFRSFSTGMGTGNVTPVLPAGWQQNDILLLACETANEAVAAPAGYAEVTGSPQGTGAAGGMPSTRVTLFWKRAGAVETDPTLIDPGDHLIIGFSAWSGCVTSGDPWDVTAGAVGASSTSILCPEVITTGSDRLILNFASYATDTAVPQTSGWANVNLTDGALAFDFAAINSNGGGIACYTGKLAVAGAAGQSSATLATASANGLLTVALRAA